MTLLVIIIGVAFLVIGWKYVGPTMRGGPSSDAFEDGASNHDPELD